MAKDCETCKNKKLKTEKWCEENCVEYSILTMRSYYESESDNSDE